MTQEKKPRPRAFVTFDPLTFELLQEAADSTGLAGSHLVNQLMRAHRAELTEFNEWIKRQEGDARIRGVHALESYSDDGLITAMQRIDPTYQAPEARFAAALTAAEVADLRAILAERKDRQ